MTTAAITQYVDVAQLVLYVFWGLFAWLIYYLQRESKREGFPLENHLPGGRSFSSTGFIGMPTPKVFRTSDGTHHHAPSDKVSPQGLNAKPANRFNGAPLEPTGNPLLAGVGPGAWADRADKPELTVHGHPLIAPLRAASNFSVSQKDINPVGLSVIGADGQTAGKVVDIWLDKAEMMFRHLEVDVKTKSGSRRVLLPINFARIGRRGVQVKSILAAQFADIPGTAHANQITMLEEEKIMAYFGAGTLYATPERQEPLF
jgi:photosynthetic reaction center H subunit